MEALERLSQFRQRLYQTFTRRATALLEGIDAVAQVARPHGPAELSLVMQHRFGLMMSRPPSSSAVCLPARRRGRDLHA